jgi:nuclear pore complex protein Nup205
MESISRLRETLLRVLSGRVTLEIEQECFDELMIQKPRLLNVLDVGQSNSEEKREVESGK